MLLLVGIHSSTYYFSHFISIATNHTNPGFCLACIEVVPWRKNRRGLSSLSIFLPPCGLCRRQGGRQAGRQRVTLRFSLTRKSVTSQLQPAPSPDDDSGGSSIPSFCMPCLTVSSAIAAAASPSRNARLCGEIGATSAAGSMYQAENLAHLRAHKKKTRATGEKTTQSLSLLTQISSRKGEVFDRHQHDFFNQLSS